MKLLLLVFLTMLSLASGANETDPAGRYVLNGVREMDSALLIRSDGTFAATMAYGNVEGRVQGRWQRQGGILILQDVQGHPEVAELVNDTHLTIQGPAYCATWASTGPATCVSLNCPSRTGTWATSRPTTWMSG